MNRKTIMVDMDGVITEHGFPKLCEEFLNRKIDFEGEHIIFRQEVIKGQEDEFRKKYAKANLYSNSKLKDNCYEVLKKLNENYDVYIVTQYVWSNEIISPSENLKNKFEFLRQELDFLDPNRFIFTTNKNIMNFDIKIDDNLRNLENCKTNLLFSSYRNIDLTKDELNKHNVIRVNDWKEIEKIVNELEI